MNRGWMLAAISAVLGCGESNLGDGATFDAVTARASVASNGAQANLNSSNPSLSSDGRYAAFESTASDLVSADTNAKRDIFVRDRLTDTVRLASLADNETQAQQDCFEPAISPDGGFVAFASKDEKLTGGSASMLDRMIFVRDLALGTTKAVSTVLPTVPFSRPSISEQGRFVVFHTAMAIPGVSTGISMQIILADMSTTTPTLKLISRKSGGAVDEGATGGDSIDAVLSANGASIVFSSRATDLPGAPGDGVSQIYLYANPFLSPGAVPAVISEKLGVKAASHCIRPWISSDGGFVAYATNDSALAGAKGIVRRNTANGTNDSVQAMPWLAVDFILSPFDIVISADGRSVAFPMIYSQPGGPLDTGNTVQVFLKDMTEGSLRLVSINEYGARADLTCGTGPRISGDGRFVAFHTLASNLVAGDTNGSEDAFTRGPLR